MQGGFGGIVHGAEDVGDNPSERADLDNSSAGTDEERGEGGADVYDGEEVRGECDLDLGEGDFEGGDGAI